MPAAAVRSSGVLVVPPRVLVIEDDEDSRELLALMLEREGHAVRMASSGTEAIAVAALFRPTAILLDISLPDFDGFEVARRLRELPALVGCRLIAVTGYTGRDFEERIAQAGFVAHLIKPVSLAAVIAAVNGVDELPSTAS